MQLNSLINNALLRTEREFPKWFETLEPNEQEQLENWIEECKAGNPDDTTYDFMREYFAFKKHRADALSNPVSFHVDLPITTIRNGERPGV